MDIHKLYEEWAANAVECDAAELASLRDDPAALEDAFACDLAFGTAGLRGILGAGPNRMNVYTVGRATQGLANYLVANFKEPSVAIARDSRNHGGLFVRVAASIMAANGVRAYVYPRVMPTPALSFAVRKLGCSGGINVTASHNPAPYNGYKVYGPDGCQITTQAAHDIQAAIDAVDPFKDVRRMDLADAREAGLLTWIGEDTVDAFIDAVEASNCVLAAPGDADIVVAYTPLNGTGLECVSRILERVGINQISTVAAQAEPDGNFPTCPYPNPEAAAALELGIELAELTCADLVLATDPDADRAGIAVLHDGAYVLLTGNEVGALLLDYVCAARKAAGEDLSEKLAITTIVSSLMPSALAAEYGFELRRTLTGFKWIGEQIGMLEANGEEDRFIFGFEESYGYLAGTHVRDKDAIVASMLICQMARWHKACGRDLVQAMDELYRRCGYSLNRTISIEYPGISGSAKMAALTASLRAEPPVEVAGLQVTAVTDYATGAPMPVLNGRAGDAQQTLPVADVVELVLEDGSKLIVRPSGTEPKIKAYCFANASTRAEAEALLDALEAAARGLLA